MKRASLLLLSLALSAAAQPQRPPGLTPQQPKPYADGVVIGTVADSRGEPLAGAWIVLEGHTQSEPPERIVRHAATDAAGRVRFTNLANGSYRFRIQMAGRRFDARYSQGISLEGPKAEESFALILKRKPVLTGRILDETGAPLLGARVQLFRRVYQRGEEALRPSHSSSTDDRGVYRIALNEPGRYWLMASHSERSFPFGSAPRSTGVAFYPNAPDLLTATPIDTEYDQEERTLDITLPAAPPTSLTAAIVSGPAGKPCAQCRYSLRKVEGPHEYEIVSGSSGRRSGFNYMGIPAGLYRILVQDRGANQGWWGIGETTVAEGRPAETLVATQPPIPISGAVKLQDPPSEMPPIPPGAGERIRISLQREDGGGFFSMFGPSQNDLQLSMEKPQFQFSPRPPGSHRLHVWVHGANSYLAGISRQGRPLKSPVLDLHRPGPWTGLELTVRFDMTSVRLRIATPGGSPTEDERYRMAIQPDPESNPFANGHDIVCPPKNCFLGSLPPGRYRAVALLNQGGPEIHFDDPEVWKKLSPWTETVNLTPGENPTIELTPAPADVLIVQ